MTAVGLLEELHGLPEFEVREAVEPVVVEVLRASLLMEDEEDFPLDVGFFDMGLSSLRLGEVKHQLEVRLGCEIDTGVLFSRPTAGELIEHLVGRC